MHKAYNYSAKIFEQNLEILKNSFSYRFFTGIQFFPHSLGSPHNQLMPLVDTWPLQVMAVVGLEVPILLLRKGHVPGGPQGFPSMQILHAVRMNQNMSIKYTVTQYM